METLIVICLLVVIVLLAHNKITIHQSRSSEKILPNKQEHEIVDIMGSAKQGLRHQLSTPPKCSIQRNMEGSTFDSENSNDDSIISIVKDEKFVPNFDEEEEELRSIGTIYVESGFATGVTFEELSTVSMLLQRNTQEDPSLDHAAQIVHKLDGTELLYLLENSIQHASQRIAILLDNGIKEKEASDLSIYNKHNFEDFDITDFT